MKTLDEVIETAPYVGTEWTNDALHYLKEYQGKCEELLDTYREWQFNKNVYIDAMKWHRYNPPLTWEELRQMKGKPVWMEIGILPPRWFLIEGFNGDQMVGVDALSVRVPFYKDGFGPGRYQAYRKERE